MSLFDWLLLGHLVGDFLLQTDDMARYKAESWPWMLRHVGSYMAVISVVLIAYALTHLLPVWWLFAALFFVFATHVILDRRDFTLWWMRFANRSTNHFWLSVVVDQVFHLLTLAVVAQVLVLVSK